MDSFCEMISIANELEQMQLERCEHIEIINSQNKKVTKFIENEELILSILQELKEISKKLDDISTEIKKLNNQNR